MADYLSVEPDLVAERVAQISDRLNQVAQRPVTLVAITKRFGLQAIQAVLAAGVSDVGESYAQELADKVQRLGNVPVRWHFVGGIQRNKVRMVSDVVELWHSVDRAKVGAEIAKRTPGASVLVQVNAAQTDSQAGCSLAETPDLVEQLRAQSLHVQGLMAIGVAGDADATRTVFRSVRAMADQLDLVDCSMGMSGDWEIAVQEGSTLIRLGSVLFGSRGSHPPGG